MAVSQHYAKDTESLCILGESQECIMRGITEGKKHLGEISGASAPKLLA
jgi:hypothetical protein